MADLGSIEFRQDPQRPAAADTTTGDVLKSLTKFIGVAIKAEEEDILGDLRGDLSTSTQEVAETQVAPPIPAGDPIFDELQKLKFAAEQGTVSQQDRAGLAGRRVLADAIKKHPKLRTRLRTEFNAFVTGDPEFAALGLQDVATAATSKLALQDIADIKDEAYGDGVGKLGMDPLQFRFGSREFLDQFLYRQGIEQQRAQNVRLLATLDSQRDLNVREVASQWQSSMRGQAEIVTLLLQDTKRVAGQVATALQNPTVPGAKQLIDQWDAFGREQHLTRARETAQEIELSFAQIDVNFADTPEYRAIENLKNSTILGLNTLAEGIATDTPTLVQAYDALEVTRQMQFEEDFPELDEQTRWLKSMEILLENIDTFGGEEFKLKNDLGLLIKPSFEQLLGRQRGLTGNGQLTSGLPVAELEAQMNKTRLDNPNKVLFGHGLEGSRAAQTAAFQASQQQFASRRELIDTGVPITPAQAMGDILADSQYMGYMTDQGIVPTDAYNEQLAVMADTSIVDMIKLARQSTQRNSAVLWGDRGESYYAASEGGPLGRVNNFMDLRDSELANGLKAQDVLVLDVDELDKGSVIFRVDEDRLKRFFPEDELARFAGADPELARATKTAKQIARQLSEGVSIDLRAKAHFEFAQQGLPDPEYLNQWGIGERSLASIFGPLEELEEVEVTVERREQPRDTGISRGARTRRGQRQGS